MEEFIHNHVYCQYPEDREEKKKTMIPIQRAGLDCKIVYVHSGAPHFGFAAMTWPESH